MNETNETNRIIWYIVFGILSFIVLVALGILALKAYKTKDKGKRIFTALHIFTLGVFVSTVFIFIPVYFAEKYFGESAVLRPFVLSIHHALRVFILDGEFDIIKNSVPGDDVLKVMFSSYASILYVLAPILTFSNVLSFFKNIKNEIRFLWHKKRPFYIFSELNERSIKLAESIIDDKDLKKHKPVIVFTDVFEQNEEDDYELILKAHDIRAILLKKDITRLNAKRKKSYIEFFLIGDNDSENTEQAIKLTNIYKDYTKRAIYLFSSKQSAGYILDSLDKGKRIISKTLEQKMVDNAHGVLYENALSADDFDVKDSFYLRRIDSISLLPIDVLSDQSVVKFLSKATTEEKRISLMIIGIGESGKAFLKTAFWLYQHFGYCVEISVLDKEEKDVIVGKIKKDCPGLEFDTEVSTNRDSNYHIRIISKIDVDSSDLGNLFESDNNKEWIKKTQLVVVSLGDDDKNIETAVALRKMFDRVNEISNGSNCLKDEYEIPLIYSIVYNEKKASNLTNISTETELVFSDDAISVRKRAYDGFKIKKTNLSITKSGTYVISGECSDGKIVVNKNVKDVILVLNGLHLYSSSKTPITFKEGSKVILIAEKGTDNLLFNKKIDMCTDKDGCSKINNAFINCKKGSVCITSGVGTIHVNGKKMEISDNDSYKKYEYNKVKGIRNYKGSSYHIRFVGSLKDQYSYEVIKKQKKVERDAIGYHLEWAGQISKLRNIYSNPNDNDNEMILEFRENVRKYFEEDPSRRWGDEHLFRVNPNGEVDYSNINPEEVINSIINYMNYEYYRNSSIAKAVYSGVYKAFCDEIDDDDKIDCICMCEFCQEKRISEHMRWNAYMRTIGYKTGAIRSDRGQIHPDLVAWDKLPLLERYKD